MPAPGSRASAPDLDELFDFACVVAWSDEEATDAVAAALTAARAEPGTHLSLSRPEWLGLVRREALARTGPPEAVEPIAAVAAAGSDLGRLARQAARSVSPADRAVLDLAVRKGLPPEELSTALDVPVHAISSVVTEARGRVDRQLANYLLAHVATEACEALGEFVAGAPSGLDALSERVDAHVDECPACADRRRALLPPTSLISASPARHAPPALQRLGAQGAPEAGPPSPRPRPVAVLVSAGVLAGIVVAAALVAGRVDGGRGGAPVVAPAAGVLRADAETVDFGPEASVRTLSLRNDGPAALEWEARTDAPWLSVTPAKGVLAAAESIPLTFLLDRGVAPEGTSTARVRVVSEGGIVEFEVSAVVEREPVLARVEALPGGLAASPCARGSTVARVTASVVEESGLQDVTLRWSGPGPTRGQTAMEDTGERFEATLGPFTGAGTASWSVEATDARGNVATSEAQDLVIAPCD